MKVSTAHRIVDNSRASVVLWLLSLVLLGLGVLGGCGTSNPHPVGSYQRALFFVEEEENLEAIAALESFVRHNPTDSLAAEAQYQKALVYMVTQEYPLAAVELQILRKDYPTCPRVEDAFFQEGVAYFKQVGKVQRDVTGAYEARLHFLKFSQEYPNSELMVQVVDYMQQISDLLVLKRLEQAKVFGQLNRYSAVKSTLAVALEDEAASTLLDQVLWERGKAVAKLKDFPEAARMYQMLLDEFPESPLAEQARVALAAMPTTPPPPDAEQ